MPCKWQKHSGPHIGCFLNDKYRKWLSKKELWKCTPEHCSDYEEDEEEKRSFSLPTGEKGIQTLLQRRTSKEERIVMMDDALWGFPLGGVLLGAHDSATGRFVVREVPVKYFQSPLFEHKTYLQAMAETALELLDELGVKPESTTLVKVCQGYVNSAIPAALRHRGYRVEVGKIGEPLKSWLEGKAAEYVRNLVYDGYYEPKEMSESDVRKAFWRVVRWVEKHNRYDIIKSGWKFWKERCLRRGWGDEHIRREHQEKIAGNAEQQRLQGREPAQRQLPA